MLAARERRSHGAATRSPRTASTTGPVRQALRAPPPGQVRLLLSAAAPATAYRAGRSAPARPGQRVLGLRREDADEIGGGRQVADEINGLASPHRRAQLASRHPILIRPPGIGVRGEFSFPAAPLIENRVTEGPARVLRRPPRAPAMSSTVLRSVSSPRPSTIALLIDGSTSASTVAWNRVPTSAPAAPRASAAATPRPSAIPAAGAPASARPGPPRPARTAAWTARAGRHARRFPCPAPR